MTRFIVMTAAEAAEIAGETTPGHALTPVPIADGRYVLPLSVLGDPAHAPKFSQLGALPQAEIDPATAWPEVQEETGESA